MENYSILMAVYYKENPDWFRSAIESIWNQTVKTNDFVLVCDGPLNESLDAVIAEMQVELGEILNVVRLETNQGLGNALDVGIGCCKNDLVARMDSDDISRSDRCEKQIERFAQNERLAVLGSNIDEFSDSPENIKCSRVVPCEYEQIRKRIRRREPFNHPTVMFKKSEVLRCGGYGTLRRCQDFDLFSRMINMGCYAENIDESLVLFRANEENYKRRKGKKSMEGYMTVMKLNYKRGYCSLTDIIYAYTAQFAMTVMPKSVMKWVSDTFLRKKKKF